METQIAKAQVYAQDLPTAADCYAQMRVLQGMIGGISSPADLAEAGALLLVIHERAKILEVSEAPEVHGK